MYRYLVICFFWSIAAIAQKTELKTWEFHKEDSKEIEEVQIPHTWNAQDSFDDEPGYWRGKGIYSRSFELENPSGDYYLHLNGANQVTQVWVNGKFAGRHTGGYTAFDIEITSFLKAGQNRIKLEVDNSHNEAIPPLDADFTFYGGIYRKVFLVHENRIHFAKEYGAEAVRISPKLDEEFNGSISLTAEVEGNIKTKNVSISYTLFDPKGNSIFKDKQLLKKQHFLSDFKVKAPELWSPENPRLYKLQLEIRNADGELLDSYEHKIGFRKIKVSTEGFRLNGKPLKLIGVNRHQDWEGLGNAVPVEKQLTDMARIKEMGANFLRLAHYPQDQEIYQAADSLGIILWSEVPVINKVPATKDYEAYQDHALNMQREQIAQNYNHPSLVFIGYMNEIFIRMIFDHKKDEEKERIIEKTMELARKLEKLTRELAPDCITVMAIHGNQIYNETGIADIPMVLGWNLYYGWYDGKIEDLGPFLDKEHREHPDRPIIISEYGVGADSRLHSEEPEKFDFTEEYQLKYHQGYLRQLLKRDFVIGMTAWNYADFGSEFRGDTRPHVNQKGLVNYDRTPKNIWYWYKAMLRPEENFSRIYRDGPVCINVSGEKEIKIISTQPAFLEVNGEKLPERSPEEGIIRFKVNLHPGKNKLKLYNKNGKLEDSLEMEWRKPDLSEAKNLALNFGTSSVFTAEDGQVWIPAKDSEILKISGETKRVKSSSNIHNTEEEPVYQTGLSGIRSLWVKVPAGKYHLRLSFARLGKDKALAYELGKEKKDVENKTSGFELLINGRKIKIDEIQPFFKHDEELMLEASGDIEIKGYGDQLFSLNALFLEKME